MQVKQGSIVLQSRLCRPRGLWVPANYALLHKSENKQMREPRLAREAYMPLFCMWTMRMHVGFSACVYTSEPKDLQVNRLGIFHVESLYSATDKLP